LSDQKAKEHRAKQTVNNLLLSILATAGLVLVMILVVPRDDSSRIVHVDYKAVAAQAQASSQHKVAAPDLPNGWWSNQATWLPTPQDTVPRFEAGFVGPKNQYIGMTQAFGINPTWLALSLKDVVLLKTFTNPGSKLKWNIYHSAEVHSPAKTRDVIWEASVGSDAVLIYGDGTEKEFDTFTQAIEKKLEAK
jgi:hypothetical protein